MAFPVKHELKVGDWWVPTEKGPHLKPRWVLGIRGDPVRVRYSNGGDGHRMCLRHSFAYWITRTKAIRNLEIPIDGAQFIGGDQGTENPLLRAGAEGITAGDHPNEGGADVSRRVREDGDGDPGAT